MNGFSELLYQFQRLRSVENPVMFVAVQIPFKTRGEFWLCWEFIIFYHKAPKFSSWAVAAAAEWVTKTNRLEPSWNPANETIATAPFEERLV